MAYVDQTYMLEHAGVELLQQLTDQDGSGAVDSDLLNRKIAQAEALVNGYAAARYVVPLSPAPELVKMLVAQIVIYLLYPTAPANVRQQYEDAIAALRDIAAGRLELGVADPPTEATDGYPEATTDSVDRIFTADTLAGF